MVAWLCAWLRHLLRRRAVDRDLDAELNACAEIIIAEEVGAGASPEAARRQALLVLGGLEPIKERVRSAYPAAAVHRLLRDLRYGLRILRGRPLFAATAVISLALGIGATSAVYAWGSAMFFRHPLDVADPTRLVALFVDDDDPATDYNIISPPHFREVERASPELFSGMGGAFRFWASLSGPAGARAVTVEYVTAGFDFLRLCDDVGMVVGVGK